ncbi:MAG: prephenate dehydratase [Crocinitomicaceae bacterium]
MKVSIQGVKGAFHEEAARIYYKGPVEIAEQLTFEDVVNSVKNKEVDAGIMAIENTISGTIHTNFDLIKQSGLSIVGEVYLRIEQNLAVNKGVKLEDLDQVQSHYMAINQCRKYFKQFPKVQLIDAKDTALSMKYVAENNLSNVGAIGSKLAAAYYGLEIIGPGIETNKKNYTRFFIIQSGSQKEGVRNKASIQFVLKNDRGRLAKTLITIDKNKVDLSKIESLPIIGEPWHYQFFIDVLYDNESDYQNMLEELKEQLESLMILGEYENQNIKIN